MPMLTYEKLLHILSRMTFAELENPVLVGTNDDDAVTIARWSYTAETDAFILVPQDKA